MPSKFLAGLLFLLFSFGPTARAALLVQSGQKVVFMGDSITEVGWGAQGGWVRLVAAGLGSLGAPRAGTAISAIPSTAAPTAPQTTERIGSLIRVLFQRCFGGLRLANLSLPGARIFIV